MLSISIEYSSPPLFLLVDNPFNPKLFPCISPGLVLLGSCRRFEFWNSLPRLLRQSGGLG